MMVHLRCMRNNLNGSFFLLFFTCFQATSCGQGMNLESPIIFYGGSFNPPHLGHDQIIQNVLNESPDSQVWVVPSAAPAAAKGQVPKRDLAPFVDRLEMCRRAFAHFGDKVYVSDLEKDPDTTHYTWDSLEQLPREAKGLVVGGDQYESFDRWHRANDLLEKTSLYVQPRDGSSQIERSGVTFLNGDFHSASSTKIRAALLHEELLILKAWLNPEVLSWIQQNDLYM
ncbi:MAG: nicotinate-nicotinamide nucleotide adenylyltransferase [Oligoflexales bacterium]